MGIVINPKPHRRAIINHLLPKAGRRFDSGGQWWSPYRTWTLVGNSVRHWPRLCWDYGPGLAARKTDGQIDIGGVDAAVCLATSFIQSRRFVNYFPAFALIFLALSAAPLLNDWMAASNWWGNGVSHPLLPIATEIAILAWPSATTAADAARNIATPNRPTSVQKTLCGCGLVATNQVRAFSKPIELHPPLLLQHRRRLCRRSRSCISGTV
ncbi:MAG: hypothetical protein H6669_07850 [Ardenticatenaceae bacterium]|nr:hypothetical protein [Ardenticatenaceae bacterium]